MAHITYLDVQNGDPDAGQFHRKRVDLFEFSDFLVKGISF
jgi:hypothetical protein